MKQNAQQSRALQRVLTGLLLILSTTAGSVSAQELDRLRKPKAPGIEVTVTAEMTGAGIVSSGVTLPPVPPVTGSRKNPVPSWGKPLPYPIIIADRRLE